MDGFDGVHAALAGFLRVADQTSAATHEHVGNVTGLLQATREQLLDEVTHMHAGRGRVGADIELDGPCIHGGAERLEIG